MFLDLKFCYVDVLVKLLHIINKLVPQREVSTILTYILSNTYSPTRCTKYSELSIDRELVGARDSPSHKTNECRGTPLWMPGRTDHLQNLMSSICFFHVLIIMKYSYMTTLHRPVLHR